MALFLRLSYWQWERHGQKLIYIQKLEERLSAEIVPLTSILNSASLNWEDLPYRRIKISGELDFAHEMVIRNRTFEQMAGVALLTPLKIDGSTDYILVNRGFVPLEKSSKEERKIFQPHQHATLTGLIKASNPRSFLAPTDPPAGGDNPWVEAWLRVDLDNIQKQLPYKILPVYAELMSTEDPALAEKEIVKSGSGQEELLVMGFKSAMSLTQKQHKLSDFPAPLFDTVVPAGRHLGYVYEWCILAVFALLIGIVLQLRPAPDRN